MSDEAVTFALAATLALLPLLPTGPQHLGLSSHSWADAALALLAAIRILTPDRRPARNGAASAQWASSRVAWACLPFALAITGAALVALAQDNPIGSSAFLAQLNAWTRRAFAPINQVADPLYPLRVWLTLVEGPIAFVLVAAICRRAADPARRARAALWGVLAGVALVSTFAVVQYFTRFHLHPYWVAANPDLVRAHSTLEDPNALGSYLVLGLGLAAAFAFDASADRWRRGLAAVTGVLACFALVTTVSRAAWASAVIGALVVAAYGPALISKPNPGDRRAARYQRWSRAGIALVVLLLLVWAAARVWLPERRGRHPANPMQAMTATMDPMAPITEVLKDRQVLWAAALGMAAEHPVAGVGLGQYPRLLGKYSHTAAHGENAHNFFLQILAETGVVGLGAFVLLVVAAARAIRAAGRASGNHGALVWGLSFGCLAFMLTMLSGHPLLLSSAQIAMGSALASGLMAAGPPARTPGRHARRAAVVASSLAVFTYAIALHHTTWDGAGGPWGYNWGLYDVEVDPSGQTFRWAGRVADLYTSIPAGAEAVLVTFAVFAPAGGAAPTVTVRAAGSRFEMPCPTGEWHQVRVPLDGAVRARAGLEIRLDVDRVGVPAADGKSQDTRTLGVRLRPPVWIGQRSPAR